jgi:PAS domain S-box-containing protein
MDHTITNHGRFAKSVRAFSPAALAVRYGFILLLCALATGINFAFPVFSAQAPFLVFFIVVTAAALIGGWRAGLVASFISILIVDFWFLKPIGSLSIHSIGLTRMVFFALIASGISWLIDYRSQSGQLIETQRGQAEEQERRHRAIASSAAWVAGMGSWEYNHIQDELIWDDETLRIFGVTRETFGGTMAAFFALVHPDDREKLKADQAKTLLSSGIIETEYSIFRPDGTIRVVYDRGQVIRHEDGKPAQSIGMAKSAMTSRCLVPHPACGTGTCRPMRFFTRRALKNCLAIRKTNFPASWLLLRIICTLMIGMKSTRLSNRT